MADPSGAPPVIRRRQGARPTVSMNTQWRGQVLPALVRAPASGASLAEWIVANRDSVDRTVRTAGALLFRDFAVRDAGDFRQAMDALSDDVLGYGERSSPRSQVAEGIYTSTDHPADQPIELHNEQSYTLDWPMRIVFFCDVAPTDRGRTPLADSRRVLGRISDSTVAAFEEAGVRYVRNYLPGISLSWQEAFQTDDREKVEEHCAAARIEVEWVGPDQLRTHQVRPAIHVHPVTGERTWFNHAVFFHVTSLPPDVSAGLIGALDEADLPYHTYYGDGRPIGPETMAELRAAYAAETTGFDWQRGDVLVVENMLVAHAREPFSGPRRILTAMAQRFSSLGVAS